jgi:hypothetical protein
MEKYNETPLILVFYFENEIMQNTEIRTEIINSINRTIKDKNANIISFVLPTNEKPKIECINPVIATEEQIEKINDLIKDIEQKYLN